jgi:copper transport protein
VTLTYLKTGCKIETTPAERIAEDSWQMKIAELSAGRWTLGLGISISDADKVSVEAPILIGSGAVKAEGAEKHHHH